MLDNSHIYDRQKRLRSVSTGLYCETVVGCGGVGTWVAITLALLGRPRLILIDPDGIEASNLNRLPYPQAWIGKSKVEALRDFIHTLRNDIQITTLPYTFTECKELLSVLWSPWGQTYCCTDTVASQQEVYKYVVLEQHHAYTRIGYDGGNHVTVSFKGPPVWGEDEGGYHDTPSWSGGAMCAAALGILGNELSIDLARLGDTPS